MVVDRTFEAMGSVGRIFLWGGPAGLDVVMQRHIDELEAKWSRFRPTSEISWLNAQAGRTVTVSPPTIALIHRAVSASQQTHGWFDPSLLNELKAAGYTRDHRLLPHPTTMVVKVTKNVAGQDPNVAVHQWASPCAAVRIDPVAGTVWFPEAMAFDPGGIGKGLAADFAAELAMEAGAQSVMVDLGGDIRMGGEPPQGGWPVHLEDPYAVGHTWAELRLAGGAVATSSKTKRRWHDQGQPRHHLIDPGTGLPSESNVVSATVVAGECWWAEATAKAALLAGVNMGLRLLADCEVSGVLVDETGAHHASPQLLDPQPQLVAT